MSRNSKSDSLPTSTSAGGPLFDRLLSDKAIALLPAIDSMEFLLLQAAVATEEIAERACEQWFNRVLLLDNFEFESRLLPEIYRRFFASGKAFHSITTENPRWHTLQALLQRGNQQLWYRNQLLTREILPVIEALTKAGVPVLALKGFALLSHYVSSPDYRYLGDIDLAVRFDDFDTAISTLCGVGWYRHSTERTNERLFIHGAHLRTAGHGRLDLHWHVLGLWSKATTDERFWSRSVEADCLGTPLRVPSRMNTLFHALVHGAACVSGEPYWVLDAKKLLDSGVSSAEWEELSELAAETRTLRPLAKALLVLEYCNLGHSLEEPVRLLQQYKVGLEERLEARFDQFGTSSFRGTVPARIAEFLRSDLESRKTSRLLHAIHYLRFHWSANSWAEFGKVLLAKLVKLLQQLFGRIR